MLKRTIKRPPTLSLLPLLCAVLLLLSACTPKRNIVPSPDNGASGTGSGGTLQAENDSKGNGATQEASSNILKASDLTNKEKKDLDTLVDTVSFFSTNAQRLKRFESAPETFDLKKDILPEAKNWLTDLKSQTDALQTTIKSSHKGKEAPGLEKMSDRLNTMLRVIQSNLSEEPLTNLDIFQDSQTAVEKLRVWMNELTERVNALPDLLPSDTASNNTGESNIGNSTAASPPPADNTLVEAVQNLSDKMDTLTTTVNDMSKDRNTPSGETPHVSLGLFGVVIFVLLVLILALGVLLFLAVRALEQQVLKVKMTDKEMDKFVQRVTERVNELPTREVGRTGETKVTPESSAPPEPSTPPQSAPNPPPSQPEPERYYFTVIDQTIEEGKPIYLKKQPNRGEILGISRNNSPSSGSEVYDIYPVTTGTTDNGRRGVVPTSILTSGAIKKCFDIPKELPQGDYLAVTVTKPAIIQQTGNNQYLLEWKYRGILSVTGGA